MLSDYPSNSWIYQLPGSYFITSHAPEATRSQGWFRSEHTLRLWHIMCATLDSVGNTILSCFFGFSFHSILSFVTHLSSQSSTSPFSTIKANREICSDTASLYNHIFSCFVHLILLHIELSTSSVTLCTIKYLQCFNSCFGWVLFIYLDLIIALASHFPLAKHKSFFLPSFCLNIDIIIHYWGE